MALDLPTLEKWQARPNLAQWLAALLETKEGKFFIDVLRYRFRATPLSLKIEPGVDYMQVNAFLNRDREAWTQVIDFILSMSVPKESKPPFKDGVRTLIREPEKEPPVRPTKKKR